MKEEKKQLKHRDVRVALTSHELVQLVTSKFIQFTPATKEEKKYSGNENHRLKFFTMNPAI
jgi:hypothetical protein